MQKSKTRRILFFDLKLSAYGNSSGEKYALTPWPIESLLNHLILEKNAGSVLRSNKARSEIFYLADIQVDLPNSRASLLINRSDRDASNTVYSNPEISHVRSLPKQEKEGNDFSAHFVLKLNPVNHSYLALLEMTPGLSSRKVEGFLNGLLRQCARTYRTSYQANHPNESCDSNGNRVQITANHRIELRGHPSNQFINELNQGVLESIELIDSRRINLPWDTHARTREVSRNILLRSNPAISSINFDRLKDAVKLGHSRDYASAKVKFRTATKMARTVLVETEHANIANDEMFVRKETIDGFSNPLETSYQSLHSEICGKMFHFL